jgi:hypothetical protein
MNMREFESCPRCGLALTAGFSHKAAGLSFVAPKKFEQFLSIDEDVARSGFRRWLPWRAKYFRSYLCRGCALYLIDLGNEFDHAQARKLARSVVDCA